MWLDFPYTFAEESTKISNLSKQSDKAEVHTTQISGLVVENLICKLKNVCNSTTHHKFYNLLKQLKHMEDHKCESCFQHRTL